jgi:ABC-type phosphate transport system substrate-binding protein
MRKYSLMCAVIGAVWLFAPLPSRAGGTNETLLVIAHKAVSVAKVSRDELRPIFQTKTNTWPDGSAARPFNLPDSSSSRQGFDAAVLGLDPDRVARYWIDRKIRGGERPPAIAPTAAVMLKIVSKTPGAIGYIEAGAVDQTVKIVAKVVDGQVVAP